MRVPPGSQLVFDQVLTNTAPAAMSDARFNDWLGRANDLSLFAVVDRVSGTISLSNSGAGIYVQEGADEESPWYTGSPSIAPPGDLSTSETAMLSGSDVASRAGRPCLGLRRILVAVSANESASARIRVWAAGRNGYRKFHRLVMKERIEGTNTIYTSHEACAWLASTDIMAFAIFCEEVSFAANMQINVGESPNGRTWAEIASGFQTTPPGTLIPGAWSFDTFPLSGFKRIGLQLSGTNPAATVRLWVTGRDVRSG